MTEQYWTSDAKERMLAIKAKSNVSRNIFNADSNLPFPTSEATVQYKHNADAKPAQKHVARRSSFQLGTESGAYVSEASANYTTMPGGRGISFKPVHQAIFKNSVIPQKESDRMEVTTTASRDYVKSEHAPTVQRKVWGNKSSVEFSSEGQPHFLTEAKSQYAGERGLPAASFKPKLNAPPHVPFEAITSSQMDFKAPPKGASDRETTKPRAARSEVSDNHLIQSIDTIGQNSWGSEASSNYTQKGAARVGLIKHASEGLNFGDDQRDFVSEARRQFDQKDRVVVGPADWTRPKQYVRETDERDFVSENRANHTHGNKTSTLRPSAASGASPSVATPLPAPAGHIHGAACTSRPASTQPRPSHVVHNDAEPIKEYQAPQYVPAVNEEDFSPKQSSKRVSQFSRPINEAPKGIQPVTRPPKAAPPVQAEPASAKNGRTRGR